MIIQRAVFAVSCHEPATSRNRKPQVKRSQKREMKPRRRESSLDDRTNMHQKKNNDEFIYNASRIKTRIHSPAASSSSLVNHSGSSCEKRMIIHSPNQVATYLLLAAVTIILCLNRQHSIQCQASDQSTSANQHPISNSGAKWKLPENITEPKEPRSTRSAAASSVEPSDELELDAIGDDLPASGANAVELAIGERRQPAPEVGPPNRSAQATGSKLRIVRLLAPEATQNGTQNVTIDCMFKFDKNLDQRLTIKWFFNDELEPIYQWIPELNKRVYSDKYERYLDKSYEVSEDLDFMLQSYRWLLMAGGQTGSSGGWRPELAAEASTSTGGDSTEERELLLSQLPDADDSRLLAGRLSRLARMGGSHSRQLIEALRAALYMEELDFSRFRALRLVRPGSELSGRFTCSISSLDGEDLRATRLTVFEPAKSFTFSATRLPQASGGLQWFNLSCQADQLFPRPQMALFRYRAGPLNHLRGHHQPSQQSAAPSQAAAAVQLESGSPASLVAQQQQRRAKLAASLLRQEPLAETRTRVTIRQRQSDPKPIGQLDQANEIRPLDLELAGKQLKQQPPRFSSGEESSDENADSATSGQQPVYAINSWALVDEASLSNNVLSQFECLLSIEGTNYEQRQSLNLQKGWHAANSAPLAARHTLVGLFSALASLLCLMLALVSSMLIFRLLKRHADKRRVHHKEGKQEEEPNGSGSQPDESSGSGAEQSASDGSTGQLYGNEAPTSGDRRRHPVAASRRSSSQEEPTTRGQIDMIAPSLAPTANQQQQQVNNNNNSDGIYRVPEPRSSFGSSASSPQGPRFVIGGGGGNGQFNYYGSRGQQSNFNGQPATNYGHHLSRQQQQQAAAVTRENHHIGPEVSSRPLYC